MSVHDGVWLQMIDVTARWRLVRIRWASPTLLFAHLPATKRGLQGPGGWQIHKMEGDTFFDPPPGGKLPTNQEHPHWVIRWGRKELITLSHWNVGWQDGVGGVGFCCCYRSKYYPNYYSKVGSRQWEDPEDGNNIEQKMTNFNKAHITEESWWEWPGSHVWKRM